MKYLGVIIDNSLCGEYIVDSIIQKVNSRLKFLYRQARFLDLECKMSLCSSLIQCHIDYASSAWYSGLSKCFKQKLQICQNKMVRFICGFSPRHTVNYTILSSLNMFNVEDRVKQLRLNHVFNIFHDISPTYLKENFVIRGSNSGKQTRSCTNLDFIVPRVKTCQYSTFYFNAIKDWNELPLSIKENKNKENFKGNIKTFLLEKGLSKHNSDFFFY